MKHPGSSLLRRVLPVLVGLLLGAHALAQTDPLPSWNDGSAKKAIVDFVQATTMQGSAQFGAAAAAWRHLRPGRHAVGRAPDVLVPDVCAGPGAGAGQDQAATGQGRTLNDAGKPEGIHLSGWTVVSMKDDWKRVFAFE